MVTVDTRFLSLAEVSRLLHRRELSPVELAQACFERIEAVDSKLNSFITLTKDLAMAQAQQAAAELAQGKDRGPLHGIPIALKDLYATKGIRTTAHSKVLIDWVPDADSTPTAKLYEAGAVLLGKLAMHEFAFGAPLFDTPFPPARNPWNTAHVTGGSSSGSGAALAAGLCYGSLGSDTGGSIRNPASQCGIVGLKPTYGRVSRHGVVTLSWSLDHVGPMARTVEDCALILQAIAGHDPQDAACADRPVPDYSAGLGSGVRGLRLGVPHEWLREGEGASDEMLAAFEAARQVLEIEGATIVEVDSKPFIDSRPANTMIITAESYAYHEQTLQTRPLDFSLDLRTRLREGAFLSAADYIQAQRARSVISQRINALLKDCDAIISPATPRAAEPFEGFDSSARYNLPSFTNPFNLTGLPAISVPMGFTAGGLPQGLQIAGRAFDEAMVLRIAAAYERATPWHEKHPSI